MIPTLFDFRFFFKGMDVLLNLDHAICTSKALWLLYHNFDIFPPDQKIEICKRVVNQKQFIHLGFHWCWHVRNLVTHIFVYILMGIYKFD